MTVQHRLEQWFKPEAKERFLAMCPTTTTPVRRTAWAVLSFLTAA